MGGREDEETGSVLRRRLGESLLPQVKSCLGGLKGLSKLYFMKLLYFKAF